MTRLRLSIVICTYNGAAYLQQQLDSLLAQTHLPDEIVMSDDGSTDASQDVLQVFAERARALGVAVQLWVNPSNLGYVENFSKALGRATGDVLFLCDQDDIWRPDKLALMAARFNHDPQLLLLYSDARLVGADGESRHCSLFDALQLTPDEKQVIHDGGAFDIVMRRSFVTGATAALRRELIEIALPVGQDWIHDEWLAAVAAAYGRVDFIDEPLIDYRQHDTNQVGMRRRTLMMKWNDLLRSRRQLLKTEAKRLQQLEDFLAQTTFSVGSDRPAQIRGRRAHFERRLALGQLPRYRRLLPIWRESRAGCYQRYGTGGRTMLRDLLRHD
jgi:glycosyltransferase involved in cell wall biosynthesis